MRFGLDPTSAGASTTWAFSNGTWTNVTGRWGALPDEEFPAGAFDSSDGLGVVLNAPSYPTAANTTWLLHGPRTVNLTVASHVLDVGQPLTYRLRSFGGAFPVVTGVVGPPVGCLPGASQPIPAKVTCDPARAATFSIEAAVTDAAGDSLSLEVPRIVVSGRLASAWTFGPDPTTVGIPVTFAAFPIDGTPPYEYLWTVVGTSGNPSGASFARSFAGPGRYGAALPITDFVGEVSTISSNVTVDPGVSVTSSAVPSVTDAGLPVGFGAARQGGTGALRLAWSFGDGSTGAGAAPSHTYAIAGRYAATVGANDSLGAGTESNVSVVVNPDPAVTAEVGGTQVGQFQLVQFTGHATGGTPPYDYQWTFADGSNSSVPAPQERFESLGVQVASLTIRDSAGESATATVSLEVVPTSPAPGHGTTGLGLSGPSGAVVSTTIAVALAALVFVALSPQGRRFVGSRLSRLRRRPRAPPGRRP